MLKLKQRKLHFKLPLKEVLLLFDSINVIKAIEVYLKDDHIILSEDINLNDNTINDFT